MIILTEILLGVIKAIFPNLAGRLLDRLVKHKLVFNKVKGLLMYSHYVGQNHVRTGGETRIYKTAFSLTVFNPAPHPRILLDLKLVCQINGVVHLFDLWDSGVKKWKRDYNLPGNAVTNYSWNGLPEGHGILSGDPGIIPFSTSDQVEFYFTYLDEKGKACRIDVDGFEKHRLHPNLITA